MYRQPVSQFFTTNKNSCFIRCSPKDLKKCQEQKKKVPLLYIFNHSLGVVLIYVYEANLQSVVKEFHNQSLNIDS